MPREIAVGRVQQNAHVVTKLIGHYEVDSAIAVHIASRHRNWSDTCSKGLLGQERAVAVAQHYAQRVIAPICHHEVGFAIGIQIAQCHPLRVGTGGKGLWDWRFLEGAVTVAQQHSHGAISSKVGDDDVGFAVAVYVGQRHRFRIGPGE